MNDEIKEIIDEFLKEKSAYSLRYSFNGDLAYSQEQILKDYITNLQNENERLKKEKKKLSNDLAEAILFNQKRCEQNKELKEENKQYKEYFKTTQDTIDNAFITRDNYKQRIDKAIEFIKECQLGVDSMDRPVMLLDQIEGRDLLKILGGNNE